MSDCMLSPEQRTLRDEARRFAREKITPSAVA